MCIVSSLNIYEPITIAQKNILDEIGGIINSRWSTLVSSCLIYYNNALAKAKVGQPHFRYSKHPNDHVRGDVALEMRLSLSLVLGGCHPPASVYVMSYPTYLRA